MLERGFPQAMNRTMSVKYSIPDNLRVYAIGDVHGHLAPLKAMHEQISNDLIKNPVDQVHIVYLGDYIDRGPDSAAVIEYLIERKARGDGIKKSFLMGNHEMALFEFMEEPFGHDWLSYGGLETLTSYGIAFKGGVPLPSEIEAVPAQMREKLPEAHVQFYEALELSVTIGDYMFVHAGVDPSRDLEKQDPVVLACIRQPFLSWHEDKDYQPLAKKIVHGHTVSAEPCVRPHRVGLDTGLYKGGPLTAGVFEGQDVRFLQVRA